MVMSRLGALILALAVTAAPAHAQGATTWRAGIVVGKDDDGTGRMYTSIGGAVQVDRAIVTNGSIALGLAARFTAISGSLFMEATCVSDPCRPKPHTHLQWFAGAGPSLTVERDAARNRVLFARGALIAGGGVAADIPNPSPVRVAFSSAMINAGLGVRGDRASLEVEYTRGGMRSVTHAEWGLLFGWRP
jgi:hypothetical protein